MKLSFTRKKNKSIQQNGAYETDFPASSLHGARPPALESSK